MSISRGRRNAYIEDVDYQVQRHLDKSLVLSHEFLDGGFECLSQDFTRLQGTQLSARVAIEASIPPRVVGCEEAAGRSAGRTPAMARFFNTAGPCRPELHYMLPPERRLPGVAELLERQEYFVLHAPRQSGKTTALAALARRLTGEGGYVALLASCEGGQVAGSDVERGVSAVLASIDHVAEELPPPLRPGPRRQFADVEAEHRLRVYLARWCAACPRPVVLFLDEIDSLLDDSLLSVLRQLRAGYPDRPGRFPHSVALIGLRDVRDYKVRDAVSGARATAPPLPARAGRSEVEHQGRRISVLRL